MRRISWFGVFLVIIGIILLLSELNIIYFSWRDLLRFWPLIFVFWGLDLLIGEKRWFGWFFALLVIVLILSIVFLSNFSPFFRERRGFYYREWRYPFEKNIKYLDLSVSVGTRDVEIRELNSQDDLVIVTSESHFYVNKSYEKVNGDKLILNTRIENEDEKILFFNKSLNKIELRINPKVKLNLDFKGGVGDANLDLRSFGLKEVIVNGGVGNITIYLPRGSFYAKVKGGVGNIDIYVPEGVILDLITEAGIGKVTVDKNIEQKQDNKKEVIHLRVETGIGNINIISEKREIIYNYPADLLHIKVAGRILGSNSVGLSRI